MNFQRTVSLSASILYPMMLFVAKPIFRSFPRFRSSAHRGIIPCASPLIPYCSTESSEDAGVLITSLVAVAAGFLLVPGTLQCQPANNGEKHNLTPGLVNARLIFWDNTATEMPQESAIALPTNQLSAAQQLSMVVQQNGAYPAMAGHAAPPRFHATPIAAPAPGPPFGQLIAPLPYHANNFQMAAAPWGYSMTPFGQSIVPQFAPPPPFPATYSPFAMAAHAPTLARPNSTANVAQHTLVSAARGSSYYVMDEQLGEFNCHDDALDAVKQKHGGLFKFLRGNGAKKIESGLIFGKINTYACTHPGETVDDKAKVCNLRIQIAEVKRSLKWVARIPNGFADKPRMHSDECVVHGMDDHVFSGPLPKCVKDELDTIISDKMNKYGEALNGFGPTHMLRALSTTLDTNKYQQNDYRRHIIERYCRKSDSKDIVCAKFNNYLQDKLRVRHQAGGDMISLLHMLEPRRLIFPARYRARSDYHSWEELKDCLEMSDERSRKYIWLPVTDEVVAAYKLLIEKDASLDANIQWERIRHMKVITGVKHLFHLMVLANEEPGKAFVYMDGTHSVAKDKSQMIPINARRVAVKVTTMSNLMRQKQGQIGGPVEASAVPLCYCKGSEAKVVTIVELLVLQFYCKKLFGKDLHIDFVGSDHAKAFISAVGILFGDSTKSVQCNIHVGMHALKAGSGLNNKIVHKGNDVKVARDVKAIQRQTALSKNIIAGKLMAGWSDVLGEEAAAEHFKNEYMTPPYDAWTYDISGTPGVRTDGQADESYNKRMKGITGVNQSQVSLFCDGGKFDELIACDTDEVQKPGIFPPEYPCHDDFTLALFIGHEDIQSAGTELNKWLGPQRWQIGEPQRYDLYVAARTGLFKTFLGPDIKRARTYVTDVEEKPEEPSRIHEPLTMAISRMLIPRLQFELRRRNQSDAGKKRLISQRLRDSIGREDPVMCDGKLNSIEKAASAADRESYYAAKNMCDWSCSLCEIVSSPAQAVEGSCPQCYMKLDCPALVAFKGRNGLYGQEYKCLLDLLRGSKKPLHGRSKKADTGGYNAGVPEPESRTDLELLESYLQCRSWSVLRKCCGIPRIARALDSSSKKAVKETKARAVSKEQRDGIVKLLAEQALNIQDGIPKFVSFPIMENHVVPAIATPPRMQGKKINSRSRSDSAVELEPTPVHTKIQRAEGSRIVGSTYQFSPTVNTNFPHRAAPCVGVDPGPVPHLKKIASIEQNQVNEPVNEFEQEAKLELDAS